MGSQPEKVLQHRAVERVKAISRLFDPDPENPSAISRVASALPLPSGLSSRCDAWRELSDSLSSAFPEVRRLAASALGKMSPERPPAVAFLPYLLRVAREDDRPQVRQYAVKAIGRYAEEAFPCLEDLKDIAREETAPSYLRTAAAEVIAQIQTVRAKRAALTHHWCSRCRRIVSEDEYALSVDRWGKPYCRHCLDERELEHKNFESTVEAAKVRRSFQGTAVQSLGEKRIADFLESEGVAYVYDERYRIAEADLIRPDFYLPEFDVYIEYFGMDTPEYRDNMLKKRLLYQRTAKRLVSVSYKDDANLVDILRQKLSRYIRFSSASTLAGTNVASCRSVGATGGTNAVSCRSAAATGGTNAVSCRLAAATGGTNAVFSRLAGATGGTNAVSCRSAGTTGGTNAASCRTVGATGGTNAVSESVES